MSNFIEAMEAIGQHLRNFAAEAAAKVEQELPVAEQFARQAASNPAAIALFSTVHLQQAPELLQALADTITKIEAGLAAAHAAGAQESAAPAEPPAEAPQA